MFDFLEREGEDERIRLVIRQIASRVFRAAALGERVNLEDDVIAAVETVLREKPDAGARSNVD